RKGMTDVKTTNEPLESSRVSLIGLDDAVSEGRQLSGTDGTFEFELLKGKAFQVTADKAGYMGDSTQIMAVIPQQDTVLHVALYLAPLKEKGDKIVLKTYITISISTIYVPMPHWYWNRWLR